MAGKAVRGAAFVLIGNVPVQLLGITSTLIAIRVLTPSDFGALSLAQTIYGVSVRVTNSGVATFIAKNPDCSDAEIDAAWTLSCVRGLLLTAGIWALAIPLVSFFGGGTLAVELLVTLAIAQLLGGLANLHVLRFSQQLRFAKASVLESIGSISGSVISITLLLVWRSPLAVVTGLVGGRLIGSVMSWLVAPRVAKLNFRLDEMLNIWRFSRHMMLNSMLIYLVLSCDNLIVSRLAGPVGLGIYAMSFKLSNAIALFLVTPLWQIMLPVFGRLQNDQVKLAKVTEMTVSIFAAASWSVCSTAFAFAPEIFLLLSPDGKWQAAVPCFRALTFYAVCRAISQPLGHMIVAKGKPGYLTPITAAQLALLFPAIYWGYAIAGVAGAAMAMAPILAATTLTMMALAPRFIPTNVPRLLVLGFFPSLIALSCAYLSRLVVSGVTMNVMRFALGGVLSSILFLASWEAACRVFSRTVIGQSSLVALLLRGIRR